MSAEPAVLANPIDALLWRYATKQFDPSRKIPTQTWSKIEEALVLTPSSFGLQPWKFAVVTDQAIREKLVAVSWNQKQPVECSHLVVISRIERMDEQHVDTHLSRVAKLRGISTESLAPFKKMIMDFVNGSSEEFLAEWMSKQCYIALGNLMTTAAQLGVDNCPMEGFAKEEYDKILGLPEKGCRSVVLCALGYRHPDDKFGKLAKVRFAPEDVIINI